ncbi:MAG: tetratricopeptide repeat protein, partial [Pseudomonadota bacterium]
TQRGFLSHAAFTPDALGKTLASDADFALAHACKGFFCALLGRAEMMVVARDALKTARETAAKRKVSTREAVYIDALADWLDGGSPTRAANRLDAHLAHHPDDILALKLVQAIRFVLGDSAGMRRSVEGALSAYGQDHSAYGYVLGCHAFTLEETGDYARAEAIGREGVAAAPDDAWGLHAVAHVHDMRGDSAAGIEWLGGRKHAWAHCNNFRYHVWWHLGLMHLNRGEIDAVFQLYDRHIRADETDDYRDISNAASLLSRLEVDGHDVGNRWEELADICETRTQDGCVPFADLHYMLALIGGGRDKAVGDLLARMRRDAASEAGEMASIYATPGLDAAQGLEAFGEGEFTEAFRHLASAHGSMQRVGGSHAQRDVFERLTVEAAIRAGCHGAARDLLGERIAQRGGRVDRFAAERLDRIAGSGDTAEPFAVA